jgi:serine/threonine protein kinase
MFKGGSKVPTSREMLRAVRRITKKDVIGEGGFGRVYKITLKDNSTFAVKKLKSCLEAARGFENELETLGEIKHCNLVKLRGYCVSPLTKLLIYDFVPNGTLDELLHRKLRSSFDLSKSILPLSLMS